jgi:plastocyanin
MKKRYIALTFLFCMNFFAAQADTVTINQQGNSFSPIALTVNVGDVIHFVWSSGMHNTTSVSVPAGADTWGSPLNVEIPTFDYTVEVAGIYAYVCTFHNGMGGGFQANAPSNIEPVLTSAPELSAGIESSSKILFVNIDNHNPALTSVRLIDITGKEVELLLNAEINLGSQNYRFDLNGRSRGMYFVRLEQAGRVITRKVMIN